MKPKIAMFVTAFSLFALLTGCGKEQPPVALDRSRPVKTMLVDAPESGGVRSFPARIDANRKVDLAFRVPGTVQELAVREADRVKEGDVIARLDPKDFQIVVNDRQASFDNAKSNFERAKQLIDKGHISKMDYDRLEAEFKNTRAALDAAQRDLQYTVLRAPFDGMVARRYIQRFQEVQAKEPVAALHDIETIEVKFDVPESIIRRIRTRGEEEKRAAESVKLYASFENIPGERFPLTFKEAATKADPKTQTFQLTYTMDRPANATILPGMTTTVTVDLAQLVHEAPVFSVPVSAVVGDYKLEPRVWVVDPESMTVAPRRVEVGRMWGDNIEVSAGIEPGDRLVTAGVPFLVEGMQVTLLPDLEQAEPRLSK